MEDVIHAMHSVAHALQITHVTDEEAHLVREPGHTLLQAVAHIVLFLLVAREDANLADICGEEVLEHGIAKAPRAAGDHEGLTGKGVSCCHASTPSSTQKALAQGENKTFPW